MKYILAMVVGLMMSVGVFAEGLPSQCPTPEGCEWRTVIDMQVVDPQGNENWHFTLISPRMGFLDNTIHNYYLMDRMFGTDEGAEAPASIGIVQKLIGQ